MNKTQIEWVKNPDGTQGYTWNPITGCLNGCEYCYARKLANTRLRERYLANKNVAVRNGIITESDITDKYQMAKFRQDPFYPRFWPERLDQPVVKYKAKKAGYIWEPHKAKGIFTCDMSDLFGVGVPEDWTRQVLNVIDYCCQDRFYLLTKQPQNLIKFLGGDITNTSKGYKRPQPLPSNCWAGVTVTNRQQAYGARDFLREVKATVKFLSLEPLLQHMDGWALGNVINLADWVIIGAQTKPTVMPKIEWVEEIVQACDRGGIPVFLKDNLAPLLREADIDKPFWNNLLMETIKTGDVSSATERAAGKAWSSGMILPN